MKSKHIHAADNLCHLVKENTLKVKKNIIIN